MLFNSHEFIFGFLPIALIGFFLIARVTPALAASWLGIASLSFYGWWSIKAIPLLLISIFVNYIFGLKVSPSPTLPSSGKTEYQRKIYLVVAIIFNISFLAFFKYANFFISNINLILTTQEIRFLEIALPIGISFYTFTQIAFLVDCWQGKVKERSFIHYLVFVSYFPHLIAGPILHHAQFMPQLRNKEIYKFNYENFAAGISIFVIGLSKKLLIADPLAEYADPFFKSVAEGTTPSILESWVGVLAYTFQIYFDFCGYSDMAIGISLFFGIQLPINFNSPYKATSIIDFWKRWHISLSAFLKNYLYIPLGGNRKGKLRRYINLLVTMLLGGLWHGANWTFVLWGAFHGVLLIINHAWRHTYSAQPQKFVAGADIASSKQDPSKINLVFYWVITFISICFTWVLFRSDSITTAIKIYQGMLGFSNMKFEYTHVEGFYLLTIGIVFFIAIFFKNSQNICLGIKEYLSDIKFTNMIQVLNWKLATAAGFLLFLCLQKIGKESPFLYFQF